MYEKRILSLVSAAMITLLLGGCTSSPKSVSTDASANYKAILCYFFYGGILLGIFWTSI